MSVAWTKEQQQVISLRDRNILVSAAAGSGKTAVLVERILSKIMDGKHPVDIDRLLIMTFTRAAAGEMRERISKALEKALYEDPDNEHLQRQMTLIHTAQITTIDGFCAYVIRNYFHLIGLDPGYRTLEEGELKLMQEDVFRRLLEDCYGENHERYTHFVECYASGKTDEGIKDLVLSVYESAMSDPWPEEWLERCLDTYRIENISQLRDTKWIELLWKDVAEELAEAISLAEEAKHICLEPGGPYPYEEALDSDLIYLGRLMGKVQEKNYDAMAELLTKPAFARLSAKKAPEVDQQKKEQVKILREEEKAILKEVSGRYFQEREAQLLEEMTCCRAPMEILVEMTRAFIKRFGEKKREKNVLDFTDLEHFALEILLSREDGVCHMSQAAKELSGKYEEVLVDEYQDTNLVQELLTTCVSGWVNQRRNTFMVGDVKQSIYRFRLARPELFMEKYKRYSLEDGEEQRIDLHRNFRSRPQVLAGVNYIFRQVMGEDLGGIAYDEAAALYPGAVFPEGADEEFVKTEVLLVEKDGEELEEEQGSQNARELEALAIAHKIQSIVGKEKVLDKDTGAYRPLEYGDIVILLRTAYGWAETFGEVLSSQGIPSYTASKTGYFSALEVVTVLNYLRICDNPLQDIPMAGVLRSPIVGCTAQELAMIRASCPKGMFYESVCAYTEDGQMELFSKEDEEEALKEKLRAFLAQLASVREMAVYTPVHQLILYVLKETGYGSYARALPDGEQRSANLSMLVDKAMDYEKTSYRGLFNFIRYMEQLQKYQVDYGEVNLSGAGAASVRIMTVHKSKGLEFPVVFAAGMGKRFNFQDMNARLLIHPELGLGADAILPDRRVIVPSLNKQVIRRQLQKESLGEELRVLYVALTRAKEKLILSGTVGKLEKLLPTLSRYRDREEVLLPIGTRMKAKNFWSYVLPALARHRCMSALYREYGIPVGGENGLFQDPAEFVVEKVTAWELTGEEILHQTDTQMQEEALKNWDCGKIYDSGIREEIEARFGFVYPYGYLKEIPVKVSVSELKKRSYQGEYDKEESLFFEPDVIPLVPRFMEEQEEEFTGAARGTAYHRLMECLDYTRVGTDEQICGQIQELLEQKKLREAEVQCIRVEDVRRFLQSPLGKRMAQAGAAGTLYREQPFVISRPASDLNPSWNGGETVLVQGIIDAYFLEDGEIVLADYKTDHLLPGQEQKLLDRYHTQLEDYAQALSRLTGRTVKEKYIYSFSLQKEIAVL